MLASCNPEPPLPSAVMVTPMMIEEPQKPIVVLPQKPADKPRSLDKTLTEASEALRWARDRSIPHP